MAKKSISMRKYKAIWMRWQRDRNRLLRIGKINSEYNERMKKILKSIK